MLQAIHSEARARYSFPPSQLLEPSDSICDSFVCVMMNNEKERKGRLYYYAYAMKGGLHKVHEIRPYLERTFFSSFVPFVFYRSIFGFVLR